MSCENCKNESKSANEALIQSAEPITIPLYAVEGNSYRRERTLRGTVIVFCVSLLVIALLMGAFGWFAYRLHIQSLERVESINRHWLDYLSKYDFIGESYEYSQDGRGLNIIGDNNGVDYSGGVNDGAEIESDGEKENPERR